MFLNRSRAYFWVAKTSAIVVCGLLKSVLFCFVGRQLPDIENHCASKCHLSNKNNTNLCFACWNTCQSLCFSTLTSSPIFFFRNMNFSKGSVVIVLKIKYSLTFLCKLYMYLTICNVHLWNPKIVAFVDRRSLFTDYLCYKSSKWDLTMVAVIEMLY